MNIYTPTAVSIRNMALFLIMSLVVVVALIYNNPFNITTNIPYQTAQAIPNLLANNTISKSGSNDTSTNIIPTANHPPVANAGIIQTVNENTTVILNGIASDPDQNNNLTYSWLQIAGPNVTLSNNNTTNPSFTSPNISSDTALKFSLTAKDDKGAASSPAVVTVIVKAVNQPPLANAGADQTVNPGHVISLDGTKSKDPDDDPLTYSWVQMQGPTVELNGADTSMATLTAPSNILADTDLIFKLTVTDSKNNTSRDDVKVTVKYVQPPNKPPIANAGVDQVVDSGAVVTLDGTGSSDPDNNPITYSWMQTAGPAIALNGADKSIPSFTAPTDISSDTDLIFTLTVADDKSGTSIDDVKVTVKYIPPPPNKIPVANAGTDQTVNAGDTVTLDGSASTDPDGSITSYSWKQIEGLAVTLSGADTSTPSFTAPSVRTDTQLKFSLTVKDDKGSASSSAVVTITAKAATIPVGILTAELTGDKEVPPVITDATGRFTLAFLLASSSYQIDVNDLADITAAHIHRGEEEENGPIVVTLYKAENPTGPVSGSGILSKGRITADNLEGPMVGKQLSDLITAMGNGETYVNIHTEQNPNGEIRGQISFGYDE